MPHQYIERFTFFFQVFDKVYASSANHTFGPHPITACHLGVLEYQFVVYTESDADTVIFCQHIDAAACGAGMSFTVLYVSCACKVKATNRRINDKYFFMLLSVCELLGQI
jgi:hypothetical protein